MDHQVLLVLVESMSARVLLSLKQKERYTFQLYTQFVMLIKGNAGISIQESSYIITLRCTLI